MVMTLTALTRGEQTRLTILQAAHDLFITQGYHGTSMRQIAGQANIALGGLYNHFACKEAVFEAVFLAFHPYQQVIPLVLSAQGANLEELLQDALKRVTQEVAGRADFMNLMFIEMVEFKSVHARQLFEKIFPKGMQILQHFVEAYPDQMRDIPAQMVVRTFLGLFIGYYLTETAFAPSAPVEFRQNALQYFIEIYLHGLLTPQALKSY
jgi:AcrR family transcriptional regulator